MFAQEFKGNHLGEIGEKTNIEGNGSKTANVEHKRHQSLPRATRQYNLSVSE